MLQMVAATALSTAILIPLTVLGAYGAVSLFRRGQANPKQAVNWSGLEAAGVAIAIYMLAQLVGGVLLSAYLAATHQSAEAVSVLLKSSVGVQFMFILLVEAFTVLMVYVFLRHRRTSFKAIGWVWPRWRDVGYILGGFGCYIVLYIALAQLTRTIFPGINMDQRQELGFSTAASGLALVPIFISLVLLPPLVEEILARGVLYSGLRTKLSMAGAGITTSLLFAAAHLQAGSGNALLWIAAIDTFTLSMVLVYLREKTGSLWAGIGLHALKNCIAFLALFVFHLG